MKWTSERPSEAGFYFNRNANGYVTMMQVVLDQDGNVIVRGIGMPDSYIGSLPDNGNVWAGPIPMPGEGGAVHGAAEAVYVHASLIRNNLLDSVQVRHEGVDGPVSIPARAVSSKHLDRLFRALDTLHDAMASEVRDADS